MFVWAYIIQVLLRSIDYCSSVEAIKCVAEFLGSVIFIIVVCCLLYAIGWTFINRKRNIVDKRYTKDALEGKMWSDDYRAPISSYRQWADIVLGGKNDNSKDVAHVVELMKKANEPITKFIEKDNMGRILVINGKWGSGKTTAVLLGIDNAKNNECFYIYESAFKYISGLAEFKNDVFNSISSILRHYGIDVRRSIMSLLKNMGVSSVSFSGLSIKVGVQDEMLTSDLIYDINSRYGSSRCKFKVIVILDDLDRLLKDDLVSTLSFLSILRRLCFVKIILPVDRAAVVAQLEALGVSDPELFLKKYLPEQTEVNVMTGIEILEEVFNRKILANQKGDGLRDVARYRPIFEVFLIWCISNKLNSNMLAKGIKNLGPWLHRGSSSRRIYPEKLCENDKYNSLRILEAPTAVMNCSKYNNDIRVRDLWNLENGKRPKFFEDVIYYLEDPATGELARDGFTKGMYDEFVAKWVVLFATNRWKDFGITLRDYMDCMEVAIREGGLNTIPDMEDYELFVYAFNSFFSKRQIKTATMGDK